MPSIKVKNLRHGVAPSGAGNAAGAGRNPIVIGYIIIMVTYW